MAHAPELTHLLALPTAPLRAFPQAKSLEIVIDGGKTWTLRAYHEEEAEEWCAGLAKLLDQVAEQATREVMSE